MQAAIALKPEIECLDPVIMIPHFSEQSRLARHIERAARSILWLTQPQGHSAFGAGRIGGLTPFEVFNDGPDPIIPCGLFEYPFPQGQ